MNIIALRINHEGLTIRQNSVIARAPGLQAFDALPEVLPSHATR
jgi:hypothetical protein